MRLFLALLLMTGCGSAIGAAAATCTVLNEHSVERLRTVAIETDLDKLEAAQGTFTVRSIRIIRQDVFPIERHRLARQANRFHPRTKERVLRAVLPFEEATIASEAVLKEAERILRSKPYLFDARVFVRQLCDGQADVDVVVRDVWTLIPSVGFNRAGGSNEFGFGLSDVNVLGLGKEVDIGYEHQDERKGLNFFLNDPNIFGSRWTASAQFADNNDGHRYGVNVARPFYALDSRFATGFFAHDFDREEGLYLLNEELWEIAADTQLLQTFVGVSNGRSGRWVDRLLLGAAYQHDEFEYPEGFPEPGVDERRFVYPYIAWQRLEDRFVSRSNLDRVGRTEDVGLGIRSYLEMGWSAESFGGIGDYLLGRASLSGRWYLTEKQLLSAAFEFSGRYELHENVTEELITTFSATYRWQHHARWSLLLRGNYALVKNLPVHRQLLLGGDTGLRGYPSRFQIGDRQYLFTIEERYYTDLKPFGLFRVGWAAFIDVGRAWYHDAAPAWVPEQTGEHFESLTDIGIGLRLESIRTRGDRIFHVDIAKPLVDGPGVGSYELTFSGKRAI